MTHYKKESQNRKSASSLKLQQLIVFKKQDQIQNLNSVEAVVSAMEQIISLVRKNLLEGLNSRHE